MTLIRSVIFYEIRCKMGNGWIYIWSCSRIFFICNNRFFIKIRRYDVSKYEEFIKGYNAYYEKHSKHLRKGQALSNYLSEYCKDTIKQIDYTEYDCFYNDNIIPLTLNKLKEIWEENNEN